PRGAARRREPKVRRSCEGAEASPSSPHVERRQGLPWRFEAKLRCQPMRRLVGVKPGGDVRSSAALLSIAWLLLIFASLPLRRRRPSDRTTRLPFALDDEAYSDSAPVWVLSVRRC